VESGKVKGEDKGVAEENMEMGAVVYCQHEIRK